MNKGAFGYGDVGGVRYLGSACVLLLLAACGCQPSRPPVRPNIVVIIVDTLRQDHLPMYGYERNTAPTLSKFAREGAVLDGLSPTSWTKPATASVLTGLHPIRHQANDREDALPDEAETLAETLSRNGYTTVGISANGFASPKFNMGQGFNEFVWMGKLDGDLAAPAGKVNDVLLPRLQSLRSPYFLYVHYIDPHTPYDPPLSWDGSPLPERLGKLAPVDNDDLDIPQFRKRPEDFLQAVRDLYDGEIRYVDNKIGELLQELSRLDAGDKTVIVITSDHGEEFEEHGRMGHGQTLYDEVTRVPLLIRAPGLVRPGRHDGRVSLLDIMPTILSLAGIEYPPDQFDGVSLADMLRSPAGDAPLRPFLLHLDFPDGTALALVDGRHKLVLMKDPLRKEFFDLVDDPRERENRLDTASPSLLREAAEKIAAAHNRLSDRSHLRATISPDTDPDRALVAIRALGYVGGPTGSMRKVARRIPNRIQAADLLPDGLLGWENSGDFASSIRVAEAQSRMQLIEGWYGVENGGRWTWPVATVALAYPDASVGPFSLRLIGRSHDSRAATLDVLVDGQRVIQTGIQPGRVDLNVTVERGHRDYALVRLERRPPFHPRDFGIEDGRALGIFWEKISFEAGDGVKNTASKVPGAAFLPSRAR